MDEEGIDAQIKIMNFYTNSKYNGIILAPNSQTGLKESIAQAKNAGTKILIIDSPVDSSEQLPFVGTNNEKAGSLAANQVAKDFPKIKKMLLFRYSQHHGSTSARESGFLSTIKKKIPGIQVVDNVYSGVTVAEAKSNLTKYFATHPHDIELIFTPNESGTEGTLLALQELNLSKKIKLYGFDFNITINDALKSGEINAVVIQDPFLMGQKSMQLMVAALTKKPYPMNYETPAVIVTSKNLNDPKIKSKTDPFL